MRPNVTREHLDTPLSVFLTALDTGEQNLTREELDRIPEVPYCMAYDVNLKILTQETGTHVGPIAEIARNHLVNSRR